MKLGRKGKGRREGGGKIERRKWKKAAEVRETEASSTKRNGGRGSRLRR